MHPMHTMHNSGMAHLTMWCMVWWCGGAWWRFVFFSSDTTHLPPFFQSCGCTREVFQKGGKNQQFPHKLQLTSSVPYAIVRVPCLPKYSYSILQDNKSMKQIYEFQIQDYRFVRLRPLKWPHIKSNFWSIVLGDQGSKKIYRPKAIVDVRCYIHLLRWSCFIKDTIWMCSRSLKCTTWAQWITTSC